MKLFKDAVPVLWALVLGGAVLQPNAATAHVVWTQGNGAHPDLIALYKFNESNPITTNTPVLQSSGGVPLDRALIPATSGLMPSLATSSDAAYPFFGPGSLYFPGVQNADSSVTLYGAANGTTGPQTIEAWIKWPSTMTSSSITFGWRSGIRVVLTRDTTNPAKDFFGLAATHGSVTTVPLFTNWPAVGTEEAPFDEWIQVGVTVSATTTYFDAVSGHDHFATGTLARMYLNGHLAGTAFDIGGQGGLNVHDDTRIRVGNLAGGDVFVDEVTLWKRDWSQNGTVLSPFSNGRVGVTAAVQEWSMYE